MFAKALLPRIRLLTFFALLAALSACVRNAPAPPPVLPDLPAGWNRVAPAGETICANGSDYAFFVHPGTVNKVVVDFAGGGACWNDGTCSQPSNPENDFDGLYVDSVYGSPGDAAYGGVYDRENPDNPLRDWYHVHISYCTADLHLGDNVVTYSGEGGALEVEHKGAVNTRAALGWTFDNFSAPEAVFVTGVSAGAYASAVWLPEIAEQYPQAKVYQLGDSGAGVVTETFFTGDAANWQLGGALPDLSEPLVLDENALVNLYTAVGKDYPEAALSQYNSLFDGTQIGFYGLMRGVFPPTPELSAEWSQKMTASLAAIAGETPDFRSYVSTLDVDGDPANGTTHDILFRPEFYTLETAGVRFVDWLGDLVNGRSVENVSSSNAPASALGDSSTLTGRVANLDAGDFAGGPLELRLGRLTSEPEEVFAQGSVSDDGSFSLQLPGEAEVTPHLIDARPTLFGPGPEECDLSVSPAAYKTLGTPDVALYSGGEFVDRLLHTSDPASNFVYYVYVDQDVTITGPCPRGMSAGFLFDLDLRKGWNTVVVDFAGLGFRSEAPGARYTWVLPSLCTPDGDCAANQVARR